MNKLTEKITFKSLLYTTSEFRIPWPQPAQESCRQDGEGTGLRRQAVDSTACLLSQGTSGPLSFYCILIKLFNQMGTRNL